MSRDTAHDVFDRRVTELGSHGTSGTDDRRLRRAELRALADAFLGEDYDQTKISQIAGLQDELHQERERLAGALERGRIPPERYLEELTACADRIFARCEEILGPNAFQALFGTTREDAQGVIDPEIFSREQRRR